MPTRICLYQVDPLPPHLFGQSADSSKGAGSSGWCGGYFYLNEGFRMVRSWLLKVEYVVIGQWGVQGCNAVQDLVLMCKIRSLFFKQTAS